MSEHEAPFYGKQIIARNEQEYINRLLAKYKGQPVTEELHRAIWDELQKAKHEGHVTIPFKVIPRRDPTGLFPEYIEVLLDTKV